MEGGDRGDKIGSEGKYYRRTAKMKKSVLGSESTIVVMRLTTDETAVMQSQVSSEWDISLHAKFAILGPSRVAIVVGVNKRRR